MVTAHLTPPMRLCCPSATFALVCAETGTPPRPAISLYPMSTLQSRSPQLCTVARPRWPLPRMQTAAYSQEKAGRLHGPQCMGGHHRPRYFTVSRVYFVRSPCVQTQKWLTLLVIWPIMFNRFCSRACRQAADLGHSTRMLLQECNTVKENDSGCWFLRNLMLSYHQKKARNTMLKQGIMASLGLTALVAVSFAVSPALSAQGKSAPQRALRTSGDAFGFFTPAAADPRLAAIYARGAAVENDRFRFTPVNAGKRRAVTVAVRAASPRTVQLAVRDRTQPVVASAATIGIAPVAYNLGAAVGWKRFALSGDVSRVDTGALPGGREAADLGISYNAKKWSSRVQVSADRPVGSAPRTLSGGESYSLDVASSYRLTRNLDVTAGVRYRSERDRLQATPDQRRDSQAVYIGTSVRF